MKLKNCQRPAKYRQHIGQVPLKIRKKSGKVLKLVSKRLTEKIIDTKTLSTKAETRAVRGTSAGVLDSVRSDPEKAGAVAKALGDGGLGRFIAPGSEKESEETSEIKMKAKILSVKARGETEAEMSRYKAFKMTTSLSDKAEVPHKETKLSEKVMILSDKAGAVSYTHLTLPTKRIV